VVDLPSSPPGAVDPQFEEMALETGGLTYGLTGTSLREKLLQNITNDICRLHLGMALQLHVTAAKMHGIPYGDLLALVRFVAPYAGYPAAADALGRIGEIAVRVGFDITVEPDPEKDPVTDGRPDQPDAVLSSPDDWMAKFLVSRTSRAWSEERLTPRERAIAALTTDVSLHTLGDSFRKHVQLLQASGASVDEIRDVVRFTAEMGMAGSIDAMAELDEILSGKDAFNG
jgi:4-carboxymuconolactone decarboxylase